MDNRGATADPEEIPLQNKLGEKQSARTKSASIVSADFETAILKSGFGKFNVVLLIVALPAACSRDFVTNSLSYVIPAATEDLQLTPTDKAMLQSSCYLEMMKVNAGLLLGHLVFMVLVNYLGKKRMLISSALFTSVCAWSVPQVSADWAFLPASGFLSFQYVIYYCSVGMIVSVFPTKLRATSISLNIVIGRIGVLFSNFLIAKYIYSYCQLYFNVLAAISIGIIAVAFFLKDKPIEDGHASN